MTLSSNENARAAGALVTELQTHFARGLDQLAQQEHEGESLSWTSWLRDEGRHGGGYRFFSTCHQSKVWNRAAINVSHVHYDDMPDKALRSADAISTIIHPQNPLAPSVHIHLSYTAMRDGNAYWRLMADLNPSNPVDEDTQTFRDAIVSAIPELHEKAAAEGDRYFHIPALGRHRGVAHYYLEGHEGSSFAAEHKRVERFGRAAIDVYLDIIANAFSKRREASEEQQQTQLDYHTVYLLQVLTLDRGTTSGLLVHNQNDQGIMGSLPQFVNGELFASWCAKVPEGQRELAEGISKVLGTEKRLEVDADCRLRLAQVIREFYQDHPQSLDLQARASVIPPTVANHGARA